MSRARVAHSWGWTALALILIHVVRLVLWFGIEDVCDGVNPLDRYRTRVRAWQQ